MSKKSLGLEMNEIPISGIEELLIKASELAAQKEPKKETQLSKP
jgi:hypothetical protein